MKPASVKRTMQAARRGPRPWRFGWKRGTAAVEFGIISIPFFLLTMGLIELCYNFYVQQMMDYATQTAAREMQIGAAQVAQGGAAAFIQKTVCNTLTGLLPCSGIQYSSQVVTDYYTMQNVGAVPTTNGNFDPSGLTFCPGQPGQLVLLTAFYPQDAINIPGFPVSTVGYSGQNVHMVVSTAAFMNEQFGSPGAQSGC